MPALKPMAALLMSTYLSTVGLAIAGEVTEDSHKHMEMDHSGHDMSTMIDDRQAQDSRALSNLADVQLVPRFDLQTGNDARVSVEDFPGQYLLVAFGFTQCGHVCPTLMSNLAQGVAHLPDSQREKLQLVFISLDPERDTPAITDAYSKNFNPEFIGLSGAASEVADAAKSFRISYVKVPLAGGGYKIDHTSISYLLSPQREIVELIGFGTAPEDIAAGIGAKIH